MKHPLKGSLMPKVKNKVGPPNKEQQIKNKISRMESSLEEAILAGNQKIVANYAKYLDVLNEAALGTLKGQTTTNQISCAKVLIEKAEEIIGKEAKGSEEESTPEENIVPQVAQLISLTAN